VVPDQLIDRTSGREQTFYDSGAVHVSFADPYCPDGRATVLEAARPVNPVDGGTMVVAEGPRFSTRAESRWFTAIGGTIVNMTGHPEAVLARELALCYTAIALVTDLDALRDILLSAVAELPRERGCPCAQALDGIKLPLTLP
jgi:5'-methylthioadenosine phosphorylase